MLMHRSHPSLVRRGAGALLGLVAGSFGEIAASEVIGIVGYLLTGGPVGWRWLSVLTAAVGAAVGAVISSGRSRR
ncbi:MAG TPA: DUF5957 family protein [Lapillicoccus sp.]|jgi:hypothetical protein|uniref:DUF5957 family protein n=1 Tax=Lapillicoccus sp. TaxID=1909287 RepID=UPI002F91CF45